MSDPTNYLKDSMYALKQNFGQRADLFKITVGQPDVITGVKTSTRKRVKVRRMIVLPVTIQNKFEYDLAFIAGNKNFTEGGFFETGDCIIIIDAKDLPKGHIINTGDYVVVKNRWYVCFQVDTLNYEYGWMIHARQTQQSHIPNKKLIANLHDTIDVAETTP